MVLNLCNVIVTIFLTLLSSSSLLLFLLLFFELLLSLLFSYCTFISHRAAKLPTQLIFNIWKQNLINVLFHRGHLVNIIRKQWARSHFVYFISYCERNGRKKNSLQEVKRCVRSLLVTSERILLVHKKLATIIFNSLHFLFFKHFFSFDFLINSKPKPRTLQP